jgi:hypothetical protein
MRKLLMTALLTLILCVAYATSAPRQGAVTDTKKINPHDGYSRTDVYEGKEKGELKRASAIVLGVDKIALGEERVFLGLYVYDEDGNCIGWDDETDVPIPVRDEDGRGFIVHERRDLAVVWYPPQTRQYTVEVRNFGRAVTQVKVLLRG